MKNIWEKRIPKIFGVVLLVIGVAATASLTLSGVNPFSKAAPPENPESIRITNITDTSLTVTYRTQALVIGTVSYGKDQFLGQVGLDDRDAISGTPAEHVLHSITMRNLEPQTKYYFSILSGKTTYLNNGLLFTATTGNQITATPSAQEPLSGIITKPDGTKPQEAIVYVTTDGGQTLSALTKSSGLYIIPLNTLRTTDANNFFQFTPNTKLQVLAAGDDMTESKAVLLASQRNPVPLMTLSNNYDFTLNTTPLASTSALPIGFPEFALDKTIVATPKIVTPADNQTFTDNQPVLQGDALPNTTVAITIHSAIITAQVVSDKNGKWSYRPTQPLPPGQHTITIETKDKTGILQTITKTFTIFASGTQVAEAATPSATPTFKPTPTPTKAPFATATPVPTKTSVLPTPTPITIHFVLSPTTTGGKKIPATGNESAVTAGIIGLVTTGAGIILFLVTHFVL